jgi:uncharacterized protein (TIGR02217 family)
MVIDEVQLPTTVEKGVRGGPQFNTVVLRTDGGRTSTNQNWTYPLYVGQVGYGIRSKTDLFDVINFFWARRGRLRGFLFKDWSDYEFAGDQIGTGNGVEDDFQIVRIYDDDALPFSRVITRPIEDTLVVKVNGVTVSTSNWSITTGGILHFAPAAVPANGHAVTIDSGEFNIPVMFGTDRLETQMELYNVGNIPNLPILEVRE